MLFLGRGRGQQQLQALDPQRVTTNLVVARSVWILRQKMSRALLHLIHILHPWMCHLFQMPRVARRCHVDGVQGHIGRLGKNLRELSQLVPEWEKGMRNEPGWQVTGCSCW